jgi:hypothetical protein
VSHCQQDEKICSRTRLLSEQLDSHQKSFSATDLTDMKDKGEKILVVTSTGKAATIHSKNDGRGIM